MLNKGIIDSCKSIRSDYKVLKEMLNEYYQFVEKSNEKINVSLEVLENIKDDDSNMKAIEKKINDEMTKIENEKKLIDDKLKELNDSFEQLKTRENNIYNKIKNDYPALSDEDIIEELKANNVY